MTKETMLALKQLNRLSLTDDEESRVLSFIEILEKGEEKLSLTNTEGLSPMVHLVDLSNVFREDKEIKEYTREQLQEHAPEVYEGYWQVPRLVD